MEEHGNGDCELSSPTIDEFPKEKSLRNRLKLLRDKFYLRYKTVPSLYLRVPGRVNLIGEHIDYCGFSVCPLALEQDILVALRPSGHDAFLSIYNQEEDNYKDYATDTSNFKFSLATTGWASYVLCGVKGVIELLAKHNKPPVSLQMAVAGNIPPGSGLSSSSALVCAGALATALANKLALSRTELAALSAEAEHYIGTVGGGMDQAIIFLASEGCAKLIEFNPLRTRDVTLPAGGVFVVAHSLAIKNKAASNDFNTRVVECRLAAQILAKSKDLPWKRCLRLADFQNAAKLTLSQCVKLVKEVLHEDPYSKTEVCKILDVSEEELNEITLTPNTEHVQYFKLLQRALHVFQDVEQNPGSDLAERDIFAITHTCPVCLKDFKRLGSHIKVSHKDGNLENILDTLSKLWHKLDDDEIKKWIGKYLHIPNSCYFIDVAAERVAEFETGCREGCSLAVLGQLMSQSHVSLRDLYECSHAQLDRLVTVAMTAGALGARLTGAGWGGCIVALTTEDHVEKFIYTVKEQFYMDNPQVAGQKMENLIFATQPGQGVQIFRPEENNIVD